MGRNPSRNNQTREVTVATRKKTTKKTGRKKTGKKSAAKKAPAKAKIRTKNKDVAEWLEDVNKDRSLKGKAEVKTADKVQTPYALRRETGILGLDLLGLGGGWPAGGCVEIHGPESSGKTFLVNHTCGMIQKNYGDEARIAIFSTELRPDKGFMRLANFCVAYSDKEIEEMELIRKSYGQPPFTKEEVLDLKLQIGDVIIISAATAESGFDVVVKGLKRGIFQLVVIDSLGALLTAAVDEGSVGDSHYAGPSRIVTQFQNKIYPLFTMDRPDGTMLETTLIGINQMRANVGGGRFDDKNKPGMGAWAWKHGQLINLRLEKGRKIYSGEKKAENFVGHMVRWDTVKGKAGTHDGKIGSYGYWHFPKMMPVFWKDVQETCYGGPGIFEDLVETAVTLGVIEVAGSWLAFDNEMDDSLSFRSQGKDPMAQFFAENPDAAQHAKDLCRREAGLLSRYT
jgi:RecA/RadA recombinase